MSSLFALRNDRTTENQLGKLRLESCLSILQGSATISQAAGSVPGSSRIKHYIGITKNWSFYTFLVPSAAHEPLHLHLRVSFLHFPAPSRLRKLSARLKNLRNLYINYKCKTWIRHAVIGKMEKNIAQSSSDITAPSLAGAR